MLHHLHIGHEIESELLRQRVTQAELARRIGLPKQRMRALLESEGIDTRRLVDISNALNVDFFALYQVEVNTSISQTQSGDGQQSVFGNVTAASYPYLEELLKTKDELIFELREKIKKLEGE